MPSSHRPEQFFAHVLDGKSKNDKNVIPMEHGSDIFENVIPMQHGKHEKKETFCWKYVKVDFCNTSRARTSFFSTDMTSNMVNMSISWPHFWASRQGPVKKWKNCMNFWKNQRRWQNQKCCSHQWWEHQKWWPRQFRNNTPFWQVPPSHYKIRHFFSTLQNTLRFSI